MGDGNSQSAITLGLNRLANARATGWDVRTDLLPALRDTSRDLSELAAQAWNGVVVARRRHEVTHIRNDFSIEQKEFLRAILIEALEAERPIVYDWQPDNEYFISYRDSDSILSITFHAPSDAQ